MSVESVIQSSNFILCCPLLLLPQIPAKIRVFSIITIPSICITLLCMVLSNPHINAIRWLILTVKKINNNDTEVYSNLCKLMQITQLVNSTLGT